MLFVFDAYGPANRAILRALAERPSDLSPVTAQRAGAHSSGGWQRIAETKAQRLTRLNIRLIPDSPDYLLILEEEKTAVDYAELQRLGLTPREAEVLHWVSEGKTNIEVGSILHSSPRTVGKHLERVFAKLDVETRTAAAAKPRLAAEGHFLPYV